MPMPPARKPRVRTLGVMKNAHTTDELFCEENSSLLVPECKVDRVIWTSCVGSEFRKAASQFKFPLKMLNEKRITADQEEKKSSDFITSRMFEIYSPPSLSELKHEVELSYV